MELKPGSRWKSAVCTAEVVVVRPPKTAVVLECGGAPMIGAGEDKPGGLTPSPAHARGVLIGKRYFDESAGIEVLGSKAGSGSLAIDGRPLAVKEPKALPASD